MTFNPNPHDLSRILHPVPKHEPIERRKPPRPRIDWILGAETLELILAMVGFMCIAIHGPDMVRWLAWGIWKLIR